MSVDTFINELIDHRRTKIDDTFWLAMEHHGYSKEWCLRPDNRERVKIITLGSASTYANEIAEVSVGNVKLFTMRQRLYFDFDDMKVNFAVDVEHFEN